MARDKDRESQLRKDRRAGIATIPHPQGRPVSNGRHVKYTHGTPDDVWEFCQAIGEFKAAMGVRFPSNGELLEILKKLGYRK